MFEVWIRFKGDAGEVSGVWGDAGVRLVWALFWGRGRNTGMPTRAVGVVGEQRWWRLVWAWDPDGIAA